MRNESGKRIAPDADEAEALRAIGWRPAADGSFCPDSTLLLAAEDGVLDDAAMAARIRAHVESCRTCQLLATDMASVFAEEPTAAEHARIGARIQAGQKPGRRPAFWWLGAAGLAAAAVMAVMVFAPLRSVSNPSPPAVGGTGGGTPSGSVLPSVFVVDRPAIPAGDVDLTVRGESTVVSLPNQIAAALDAADQGDLSTATSRLADLVRKNPVSRSASLALGAVRLGANQNADAVATLERARLLKTDPLLDDEADWFLSIALVRTGNRNAARELLDGVCKRGGVRSARACAGVAEIDRLPASR